jgi:hypothetical protein
MRCLYKILPTFLVTFTVSIMSYSQITGNAPTQPRKNTQTDSITTAAQQSEQKAPAIVTLLKKSVAFLTTEYRNGATIEQARGTAFFVFYEDKRLGEDSGFLYVVTNKHVVAPRIQNSPVAVTRMSIRLNLKSPEGDLFAADGELRLGSNGLHWCFPQNEAVDLAVLPLAPDQQRFDYQAIPISLFATEEVIEKEQIAEGDSLLLTGFFYQFPGQKKIQPIVREGILAMMPDEELQTTLQEPGRLYFADAHVFGGNSGAPVFVNVAGLRRGGMIIGGFPYRLIGVVSGYFYESSDFKLQVATTLSGAMNANSGISLVVPAQQLKELLDCPELVQMREDVVRRKISSTQKSQ